MRPVETVIDGDYLGGSRFRSGALLSALSTPQLGLVARRQLVDAGVTSDVIDHWVRIGRLHAVHPAVYLVGHRTMAPHARELAAVLACAPGDLLSHRAGVELWGMIEPRRGFVPQVTTLNRKVEGPRGIRLHTTSFLPRTYVSRKHGIPVTSPTRSILDFASQATHDEVAKAYEEGLIKGLFDRNTMISAVCDHKGRRGIRIVRELVDRDAPPSVTIREAHWQLLQLIRRSHLPHPKTEVRIGRYRVDILYPEQRVVVEMDGAAFHSTPGKRESDTARDADLVASGFAVIRVTWNQLTREPHAVIARIARVLESRSHASAV